MITELYFKVELITQFFLSTHVFLTFQGGDEYKEILAP